MLTCTCYAGKQEEILYHAPFVLPWMEEGSSTAPVTLTALESKHTSAPYRTQC